MERKSGEDLAAEYPDPRWRENYLELVNLATLLRYCIIPASYRISDRMNEAIALTEYGKGIHKQLVTKHEVPAKEARMMCFLEIAHEDIMVDLEETKLEVVREEISAQIEKEVIRYPFIFGGLLYRRAADLFPDRRSQLNAKETRELLEGTPCGVFQTGTVVVGPGGALVSRQSRWLPPDTRLPLQHCHEATCHRVHFTAVSTDYEAVINQHLPKMAKVLDDAKVISGAWTEFTGILSEDFERPYDDFNMNGLPVALGDSLTDEELSAVHGALDPGGSPPDRDRASLLQMIWLHDDAAILRAVDGLVQSEQLRIPIGEVRRPKLAGIEVGSYGLRTEIGRHGVRFRPGSAEVPALRLARLVGHLYDTAVETDSQELLWQLRGVDGASVDDRLAELLRREAPARIVRDLVLARRNNVERALNELHVDTTTFSLGDLSRAEDDDALVERILWKLGFDTEALTDASALFNRRCQQTRQLVRDAQVSSIVDVERLKSVGRELFIDLEGVLDDSLAFTWWALTQDHVAAPRPFTYVPKLGERAWKALSDFVAGRGKERLRLGSPRTLYALGQSFGVLADLLEALQGDEQEHRRPDDSIPKWAQLSELSELGFSHTVPFLDLTSSSREALTSALRQVSETLRESNVHGVRNSISHFQRATSSLSEVAVAVEGAGKAIEVLDGHGLTRVEYRSARVEHDQWGRSVIVMRSARGDEIAFSRPSRVGAVGLPPRSAPQFLVRSAVFGYPNEILRFRAAVDSDWASMWDDYPLRRGAPRGRLARTDEMAGEIARTSHGVLPQT